MTTEDRDLLMKDLCGRLPYKVRCKCVSGLGGGKTENGVLKYVGNCYGVISNYYEDVPLHSGFVNNVFYPIENVKPYLRRMSSMTEEEEVEYDATFDTIYINGHYDSCMSYKSFDFLNKKMFDYRGLIERGLALEAPAGMYAALNKETHTPMTVEEAKAFIRQHNVVHPRCRQCKESFCDGCDDTVDRELVNDVISGKINESNCFKL
jgi:hypothetical protein